MLLDLLTETLKGWGITAPALPDLTEYGISDSTFLFLVTLPFLLLIIVKVSRSPATGKSASDNAAARSKYQQPVKLPKTGNRGLFDKFTTRWIEPLTISGVTIETSQKHIAIGATTGARKTTLIANMIMQAQCPVVVIAGDSSPYALEAMRARGWRVWSADGKNGGLFVLEGTPHQAAQIATVLVYPPKVQSGTGLQLGMVRNIFRDAIQTMDDMGIVRSLPALADALFAAEPPRGLPSKNFDAAKVNWIARIENLVADLGPALGNDISVVDCVRSECGLFFDLNAFSDLDLAQTFAEAAVRLTQHAADRTGKFWWVIDELGLFDADLLGQIVRTCRIRGVKFVGASQIISDFGKTLRGLVKIWYVGEQTAADHESRKWCSDLTMGYAPPENFSEHATPPGFYYVVADGHTQSLQIKEWHHPRPIAPVQLLPPIPGRPGFIGPLPTTVSPYHSSQIDSVTVQPDTVVNLDEGVAETTIQRPTVLVYGPPEMPAHWAGDEQLENIWTRTELPDGLDGCYLSTFRTNNRGRPMCTYKSDPEEPTQQWLVYALSLALFDAQQMGMDDDERIGYLRLVRMHMASQTLTVEHQCERKTCIRTDHIEWSDRGTNVRLYFERRRQAKARVAA